MTTCLDPEIWICTALDGIVMLGGGGGSSAPQTTTTTSSPWGPQQNYLIEGFQGAQNLYGGSGPQYYPGSTYSGYTPAQLSAIGQVPGVESGNLNGIDTSASGFENNLLGGSYLSGNPALSGFSNFSSSDPASVLNTIAYNNYGTVGQNPGTNMLANLGGTNMGYGGPGSGTLQDLSGTNLGVSNSGTGTLGALAGTNLGLANPGTGTLAGLSGLNLGVDNLGTPTLAGLSNTNLGFANPGTPTLGAYASGAYGSNPATNAVSQNVLSQVVPSVESQFINGGALSSPSAAYSAASGATTALAPSLFQNYQTQEQLQQNAAQNLAGNYLQGGALQNAASQYLAQNALQGGALQGTLAQNLAQNTLQGGQLQGNAAQNLAGNALAGGQLQGNAAQNLASNYLQGGALQSTIANEIAQNSLAGTQLQENAAGTLGSENLQALSGLSGAYGQGVQQMLTGSAFAPSVSQMPYNDISNLFGAGAASQTNAQNQLNSQIAAWNYGQTLPYQMLNQYIGQVTGNYGGTVTEPYFANSGGSNALGGALSGASAGAGIGSALFGAGTGGAAGGAGLGALAGLLLL